MKQTKLILGIETSCDETAAAVVQDGKIIRSNVIFSQIDTHTLYGGVVPEIASRKHIEKINQVIAQALQDAEVSLKEIDAIGVTYGPGLVGALLVGVSTAKAIAYAAKKPLVGVNHIIGHICANYLTNQTLQPPFLCLVVSGGHTHLILVKELGEYEIISRTRDDAAGEAFDKVARVIGLGYPGGPKIEAMAKQGNASAIAFPRAKMEDAPYDFSFSGLKSAVLNYVHRQEQNGESYVVQDVAASFQEAVIDALVSKTELAAHHLAVKKLALAGGVAANQTFVQAMQRMCDKNGIQFYHPEKILCTDNAAMIAAAAYEKVQREQFAGFDLNAVPNLKIGSEI